MKELKNKLDKKRAEKIKEEVRMLLAKDLKDLTPEEREALFVELGISRQDTSDVIVRRDTGTLKAK